VIAICPASKVAKLLGRPRDISREHAIEKAAVELIQEVGYERCTIEAIAIRARASKATIYRRWRNKQELFVSALDQHSLHAPHHVDNGNLRDDLVEHIAEKVKVLESPDGALIAELISAAKSDGELGKLIPKSIREQQDTSVIQILERGRKRGEISSEANVELLLEIIPAIFTYRIFTTRQEVDRPFIEKLVDGVIIPALQNQPRKRRESE
jgi:AcrR family transcriptional regulator